jgi:hypothetical protein
MNSSLMASLLVIGELLMYAIGFGCIVFAFYQLLRALTARVMSPDRKEKEAEKQLARLCELQQKRIAELEAMINKYVERYNRLSRN